jgi:hypothetical protein
MAHSNYNKKEDQMAIKWITKQSNNKADVTIKLGNDKRRRKSRVVIIFRNDVWKKITDSGYLKMGVDGNRIYFVQGLMSNGYKVTTIGNCNNRYIQLYTDLLNEFEGDYTLKRDAKTNLIYIQKGETKNGK